jgi:hypothetical protein
VYAQIAADFAWSNHPGFFPSPGLEAAVRGRLRGLHARVDRDVSSYFHKF